MPRNLKYEQHIKQLRNFIRCRQCQKDCYPNPFSCGICNKQFHFGCLNWTEKKFESHVEKNWLLICSNECYGSLLPFQELNEYEVISTYFGNGKNPCKSCRIDCVENISECKRCYVCDRTVKHSKCIKKFNSSNNYICGVKCVMATLPFSNAGNHELLESNILNKKAILKQQNKDNKDKSPANPKDKITVDPNAFVKIDHFLNLNCTYVDPNEVNDNSLALEESTFSIFHNNISSLEANFHKVEEIFGKCHNLPDILAFSETRLNNVKSSPDLEGYKYVGVNSPTSAGGVGMYISIKRKYSRRKDLSLNTVGCEDIWVEINDKTKGGNTTPKFVVGLVYRHPDYQYETFLTNLCITIDALNKSKANYVVVGDFNIDILKYNLVSNVTKYINSLNSIGCKFLIDKATRVTSTSSTCIDHIYSNIDSDQIENQILMTDASDHYSTLTKIRGIKSNYTEEPNIYRRKTNLSHAEWGNFNAELNFCLHQKLSYLSVPYDVNFMAQQISEIYQELMDKYMPLQKLTRKERRFIKKPWITRALQESIARKNILFRMSKSNPNIYTDIYTNYRNVLNKLKTKAKDDYYREKIALYGQNKSKTWQIINEIAKRKRKNASPISHLRNKQGQCVGDAKGISDLLNKHFGTIGEIMASEFDDSSIAKDPLEFIPLEAKTSIYLMYTNVLEILKLISNLDNKKACGYDHISNKILKSTKEVIAPFVAALFNSCIKQGIFPDTYKTAHVIPLFKGGDREDPNCYRPISLLPAIGKLLEKVISIRVIDYFDKFGMLCPHQFGFRAKFSTEYAILDIHDKLLNNLDKKLNTCAIFLDFAKAFDSVSHEILIRKMEKYGVRGNALNFFKSYLSSRNQIVSLNNILSSPLVVKFGVPQGSILGPLLFLIFINDLPYATNFFVRLFADDTFLCTQNENDSLLENEVNNELQKVHEWLAANKLTLNVSKSKFMIISKKKQRPNLNVKINGQPLEECDTYKYLGVIIDKDLTWKPHIEYICKKISMACGSISKIRHCVDIDTLIEVYHALVYSYLRYGAMVWGHAPESSLQPLITLLNRVIRVMTFAPFGIIDLDPIYKYLNILELPKIIDLETAKFTHKMRNGLLPVNTIADHFEQRPPPIHSYNLRERRNELPNIIYRTEFGDKSIHVTSCRIWNAIPDEIKQIESPSAFKKQYKKHLLE